MIRRESDLTALRLAGLAEIQLRFPRHWHGHRNGLQRLDDGIRELASPGLAADIARDMLLLGVNMTQCRIDVVSRNVLVQMMQHENRRAQHSRRIRHVLARNVGR